MIQICSIADAASARGSRLVLIATDWPSDAVSAAQLALLAELTWPKRILPTASWRRARARGLEDGEARRRYAAELRGSPALERLAMHNRLNDLCLVHGLLPDDRLAAEVVRAELLVALSAPPPRTASLAQVLGREHEALLAAVASIRLALLENEVVAAAHGLLCLSQRLRDHAHFEEAQLFAHLPEIADLDAVTRAAVLAEHTKIEASLGELSSRLDAGATTLASPLRLLLLDATGRLEHLLEHHFAREEQQLFPRLDTALSEERRRSIVADFERQFGA